MIKWRVLLIALFMLVGFNVRAEGLDYYLRYMDNSLNKSLDREEYFIVSSFIENKTNSNYHLKSGKLTIRWDSDYVELVELSPNNYYENSDFISIAATKELFANRIVINYTLDEGIASSKKKLFDLKFKIKSDAKADITKIIQMDGEDSITCIQDEETFKCGDSLYSELNLTVLKSNDNLLSSIKVDGTKINNFNENTKNYNINTEKESINIEVTKKDTRSSISGDVGTKKIEYGINTFKINVTSESGSLNTYNLYITRDDKRSSINTLNTLKLSVGLINFKNEVTEYNVDVENEVDRITITSSLTDPKAQYEIDYRNKEIMLSEGLNKIQIKVIAENESTKIYTLNITRALSGNNSLKELKVNDDKIELKEGEFYYTYTVPNEIENVRIKALTNDENAKVEIENNKELAVGENEIKINVTAHNGSKAVYYLVITRKKILSNNSSLQSIEVTGYNLDFKKDTKYYYIKIKNENTLDIKITPEDENSKIDIEGNKNLINGSIIKIIVRAEDNSITRYFINIEKESKPNIPLIIILGVIVLVPLVCITIIIIRKYKKKNNELKKIDNKDMNDKNEEHDVQKIKDEEPIIEKKKIDID